MATTYPNFEPAGVRSDPPVTGMATAMALLVVMAFSTQWLLGRSTFHSPWLTHLHAVTFMGWVAIFLVQTTLGARRHMALHRKLGWFSVAWMALMVVMGFVVTIVMVRKGTTPFFFLPQHFLIFDPLNVLAFAGLSGAAIGMRRRTDWHARLHLSAMALLMGPAFGRLLPLPLLQPYAYESAAAACALFPIAGMAVDYRRSRAVHPAWWVGLAVLAAMVVVGNAITRSPLGDALYRQATAGSPGAAKPGLVFAPPPPGPLMTGR
ncbi:MAG TPA: hypothetical protein VM055_08000 [Novosphingobium sp.]|nr:hypothetical protein [Novosphingobium sp.]